MSYQSRFYPRFYDGYMVPTKLSSIRTGSIDIRVIKLSSDGNLLAIGDDRGLLDIRSKYPQGGGRGWENIRLYNTGGAVRAIVWHPVNPRVFFSGSANGNVYRIELREDPKDDNICCGEVPAFIHHLSLTHDGDQLAICYGYSVVIIPEVFRDPTVLGRKIALDIPRFSGTGRVVDCPLPRAAFFLNKKVLLVVLLGRCGIMAFSTFTGALKWRISLAPNSLAGSCAISASRERLAIKNLSNGIDWYSTSHQKYVGTTSLEYAHKFIVDLAFLDEETVSLGSEGSVLLASFGFGSPTGIFNTDDYYSKSIQILTCGIICNYPVILAVCPRKAGDRNGRNAIIHISQIESRFGDVRPFVLDEDSTKLPGTLNLLSDSSEPSHFSGLGHLLLDRSRWIYTAALMSGLAIFLQQLVLPKATTPELFHASVSCTPEIAHSTFSVTDTVTETETTSMTLTSTSTTILMASVSAVTETSMVTRFLTPTLIDTTCFCTVTGIINTDPQIASSSGTSSHAQYWSHELNVEL